MKKNLFFLLLTALITLSRSDATSNLNANESGITNYPSDYGGSTNWDSVYVGTSDNGSCILECNDNLNIETGGIFISLGTDGNGMIFNGEGGIFSCTINTNSTNYIAIGYQYSSGFDNFLLLTNRAVFYANTKLGIGAGSGDYNSLAVTDGSSWYNYSLDGAPTIVGSGANNNSIIVKDNSFFSSSVDIYIGYSTAASFNSLTVSDGSTFSMENANLFIGDGVGAYGNSVNVEGNSSLSAANIYLGVGSSSSGYGYSNSLVVSNGGTVTVGQDLFVGDGGYGNIALITDSSSLTCFGTIYVGYYGFSNSMVISNGSSCSGSNMVVGFYNSNNTLFVGSNSTLDLSGNLTVGNYGDNNNFILFDGNVELSIFTIGSYANYNNCTNSSGSLELGSLTVGYSGNNNNFINSNASVTVNDQTIVGSFGNSNNIVVSGGLYTIYNNLFLGYSGNNNNLILSDACLFNAISTSIYVGYGTGSQNSVTITGDGTFLFVTDTFYLGYGNNNNLTITNGGEAVLGSFVSGVLNTSEGNALLVAGLGSSLIGNNTNYYSFVIGTNGSYNSLTVSNGGSVNVYYGVIGFNASASNNSALVTDAGSTWTIQQNFYVGFSGNDNSLVISNGGQVFVTGVAQGVSPFGSSYIGLGSSGNSVLVTGTNSLFSNSGSLFLGNIIGSNNTITIADGGEVIDYNTITYTTSTNRSSGVVTTNYTTNFAGTIGSASGYLGNGITLSSSSSLWKNIGDIAVGYGSDGSFLTINAGTTFDTNGYIGYLSTASNNIVTVNGANSLWTNKGNVYIGYGGINNSLIVTNGGIVSCQNLYIANKGSLISSNIYISGGILQVSDSLLSSSGEIIVGETGPNGVIVQGINASSSLLLTNNSTLTASQGLLVTNGILYSFGSNTISNTEVTLEGGGSNTAYLSVNGTLNMESSPLNLGQNSFIAMPMGTARITTTSLNSLYGTVTFDFTGTSLNNNTNILINYSTISGVTNYVANGMQGITFANSGTNISEYISTNANFVSSVAISQTNLLTIATFTFEGSGITNYITSSGKISTPTTGGVVTLTNNTTVNNNGIMVGDVLVINSGCTLSGNGTNNFSTTTNNGTISPGNSPGNLHFTGDLYCGETSIIIQEIAGPNFNQYDHVTVNGTLLLNGLLDVRFLGELIGHPIYTPSYGQIFTNIIIANGGITGSFDRIVAPTNYRGRLLYVYNENGNSTVSLSPTSFYNSIDLLMGPSSYTLLAQNQNQSNVATALNSFIPATSGDELTVSAALDHLNASEYPTAFNQIMPSLYQSLSTIAFNQANGLNMELIQRLWGARIAGSGFSMNGFDENIALIQEPKKKEEKNDLLRPGAQSPWGVFLDGNGIFSQANSGGSLATYNTESGGVTTGLTYQWNEHAVSGLYSGYQGNYTKFNGTASGSLISDSVLFGLFGSYALEKEKGFFVDGLIGGGYGGYTMQRNINFSTISRTATGNPGSGMLNAMAATGYDFKKGKWTYGPTMNLQYAYFGVPSFNETGAGSLDLQNVSWNTSSMIYSLGSHVAYCWEVNKQWVLVPQLNLSWQHEFLQNSYDISANLGGINFNNTSSAPLRDTLYTGIGFSLEFEKKWNASFFYNAAAGNSDLMSQNIFLSLGMRF